MPTTKLLPLTTVFAFALIMSACTATTPTAAPESAMESENEPAAAAAESESMTTEVRTTTNYVSPAGPEDVSFILMVDSEGVITEAKTEVLGKAPISIQRQESFAAELPAAIVGKKLAELTTIDRVGGSSLTTGAFNAVLLELQAQL